jgi:hypothetical protein
MQELGDVAAARIEFERWLERQPLAERTKSEYRRNVRVFLDWLAAPSLQEWLPQNHLGWFVLAAVEGDGCLGDRPRR